MEMTQARIYRPAKNAMQSGRRQTRKWVLEYEPASSRSPDSLMGWASAADTLNEVQLLFDNLEEAKAFAERQGLSYSIITPQRTRELPKSYADNFRYDRVRD
jgi:ETC complex I subunit conserved region